MKNPDGWGDDELTAYFEHARQNSFASFANAADAYAKLAESENGTSVNT